jgi:hypothetical protein
MPAVVVDIPIGEAFVTITSIRDGGNLPQNDRVSGVFNPDGLNLRAQIRSTGTSGPADGNPLSELIQVLAGDMVNGVFTVGPFMDNAAPVEPGPAFLHVWAYANAEDPPVDYEAHHAIAITIVQTFAARSRGKAAAKKTAAKKTAVKKTPVKSTRKPVAKKRK